MTTYELLCRTHWTLIQRGEKAFSGAARQTIVQGLLAGVTSSPPEIPGPGEGKKPQKRQVLYPWYYQLPAAEAETHRLLTGQKPKTRVFAANHYELETLRLLALWGTSQASVTAMLDRTLQRLDGACFGRFCPNGECMGASVAALRFLSAVRPADDPWVQSLLTPLAHRFVSAPAGDRQLPTSYFCLALTGLPADLAAPIIRKRKDFLRGLLHKGWLTGPAEQDRYNPLVKHVLRNTLALLPDCQHLREAAIVISPKDGRCYCEA